MSDAERFVTVCLLTIGALWMMYQSRLIQDLERQLREANGWHAEALNEWKQTTKRLNMAREQLEDRCEFAQECLDGWNVAVRRNELSRGIDPRRDALWPHVDLGPYIVTTQLDESEQLS